MGRLIGFVPAQAEISLGLAFISRFPSSVESLQDFELRLSLQVCAYLNPPDALMMNEIMKETTPNPTDTRVQVFALFEA
jgi:hypothetical protein